MRADDVVLQQPDVAEIFERARSLLAPDLLDLAHPLRGVGVHADAEPVGLGARLAVQPGAARVARVRADGGADAGAGLAVPALGEGDAVAQPRLADLGVARVVAVVQP